MKKLLSLVLTAMLLLSFVAFGSSAAAESAFPTKYNWSFSTTYASASVVVQMYQKFAELANTYTDGAITINVFADGTIASEDDAMAQVASGELEFCGTGTGCFWNYSADYAWIMAPFLITDKDVYERVYNSDELMAVRNGWATKNNSRDLCGCFYRGMRTLVSAEKVENAGDLQNLKLRMNSSAMWNAAWQALGCTTVTIPLSELYTSIQTGVVASCENPLSESGNLNVPEIVKYVVPTNHVAESSIILMSNSLFESLPANYQEALVKAGEDAMAYAAPMVADEEAYWLKKYTDAGCEVVEFDTASVKAACEDFWREKFATEWTGMSYEDVLALIERCSA